VNKSVNVEVTVLATLHDQHGVEFHCSWPDDSGAWHSGPISFPYGASRNKLKFKLDDKTGLDLEFLDQPHDAIWFDANSCPVDGNGTELGQITDKEVHKDSVSSKRKKLTLTNLNTQECSLHYALRFTGKALDSGAKVQKPLYVCDPELRNRGGGTV
jgi:hypothetical protein